MFDAGAFFEFQGPQEGEMLAEIRKVVSSGLGFIEVEVFESAQCSQRTEDRQANPSIKKDDGLATFDQGIYVFGIDPSHRQSAEMRVS